MAFFKRLDLGLAVGGGLDFPVGPASGFVEGRYSFGLWNVSRDAYESKLKTRGFLIGAGLAVRPGARSEGAREPARSESTRSRRGAWIGFGLGHGLVRASCSGWVLNVFSNPCESNSGHTKGATAPSQGWGHAQREGRRRSRGDGVVRRREYDGRRAGERHDPGESAWRGLPLSGAVYRLLPESRRGRLVPGRELEGQHHLSRPGAQRWNWL